MSEFDDESGKTIYEVQVQLNKLLPNRLPLYSVPIAFGFALITYAIWKFFTHSSMEISLVATIVRNLLLCGASSFFIVGAYYDYRIGKAGRRLLRQKNDKSLSTLYLPQLDKANTNSLRKWMGFDKNWLHEGEGANVPSWLGSSIIWTFKNLFFLGLFLVFLAMPSPLMLKGILLIIVVCLKGWFQLRAISDLKRISLFVAREPNLKYLLKSNFGLQVRDD